VPIELGLESLICCAGGAAHLAGGHGGVQPRCPYRRGADLWQVPDGLDFAALDGQCRRGARSPPLPINGGRNAGMLAAQINATATRMLG